MGKYKICHVTSAHNSTDTRIFEKECSSLAKKTNYEVYLVAKGESYIKNNVHIIGVGNSPKGRANRIFQFSKRVAKCALDINADIYHFHDPELLQYVGMYKRAGKIVVFDSHEDVEDSILDKEYLPQKIRKIVSFFYSKYSHKVLKKCDAVISVTPHLVKKLKRINSNTYMVTNYPLTETTNIVNKTDHDTKTIVFAGGISSQWSHDMVIKAISGIDNLYYNLYGSGDDNYINELKTIDGWEKTFYHGSVPFSEVKNALSISDISVVLLQPSHNTAGMLGTLGNTKLFESMYAGLPIICTNFDLWKKVIKDNKCGICISPYSIEELVSAIKYLLDNPAVAKKMGENGYRAVLNSYNWSTQEQILFDVYVDLIKKVNSKC